MPVEASQSLAPNKLEYMTEGITRFTETITLATNIPKQDKKDPEEIIFKSLCLTDKIIEQLNPAIKQLGYNITTQKTKKYSNVETAITLIKNHKWEGWFIHIPKEILDNPIQKNTIHIFALCVLLVNNFRENQKIFILSEELEAMPDNFGRIFEKELKEKSKIKLKFIPWRCITKDLDKKNPTEYIEEIKNLFGFEEFKFSPTDLSHEEKEKIKQILIDLASTFRVVEVDGPKRYFINLIEDSDIPEPWKLQICDTLINDTAHNANHLIDWSINKGIIPEQQQYTLIRLLELIEPTIGDPNNKFLKDIIKKYGMELNEG